MLGIFLLLFIFVLGLNILMVYSRAPSPSAPAMPPFVKQENFLDPKNQATDYRLLADVLPTADLEAVARSDITSENCRMLDASEGLMLEGNYSQRTNNYLRTFPDSCSAPRHEFLLDFYNSKKLKPIQDGALAC
jgi:hypothetical protein